MSHVSLSCSAPTERSGGPGFAHLQGGMLTRDAGGCWTCAMLAGSVRTTLFSTTFGRIVDQSTTLKTCSAWTVLTRNTAPTSQDTGGGHWAHSIDATPERWTAPSETDEMDYLWRLEIRKGAVSLLMLLSCARLTSRNRAPSAQTQFALCLATPCHFPRSPLWP